ncbi:hypothetical protein [Tessaracoccus sp.]|uniref:hypothetical protein n=1 Tax=Tessaracoccus sp. TaxID=1971211 RepID=UPI002636CCAB|nr:hypothetical protein [Tessaracoccus sp.]
MLALDIRQLQRPRDGFKDAVRCTTNLAALQARVVADAHAGQGRDLFASQAGHTSLLIEFGQSRSSRRDQRPAGDQELPHLLLPSTHAPNRRGARRGRGSP